MAGFTFGLGYNVIARLANRGDIVVATRTSFRSARKDAAFVARIACNFGMGSGERKACCEMVKLFLG